MCVKRKDGSSSLWYLTDKCSCIVVVKERAKVTVNTREVRRQTNRVHHYMNELRRGGGWGRKTGPEREKKERVNEKQKEAIDVCEGVVGGGSGRE